MRQMHAALPQQHSDRSQVLPYMATMAHLGRHTMAKGRERTKLCSIAKDTYGTMYTEAARPATGDVRKKISKHAMKSESAYSIGSMLALAQTEPGIAITPSELDDDPWFLNVKNGTIDLKTGKLQQPSEDRLITKLAPVDYSPSAKCPQWLRISMRNNEQGPANDRFSSPCNRLFADWRCKGTKAVLLLWKRSQRQNRLS